MTDAGARLVHVSVVCGEDSHFRSVSCVMGRLTVGIFASLLQMALLQASDKSVSEAADGIMSRVLNKALFVRVTTGSR